MPHSSPQHSCSQLICLAHLNVIDGKGRVIRKLKARVTASGPIRTAVHTVFPTRSICCKRHINSRIIGDTITIGTAGIRIRAVAVMSYRSQFVPHSCRSTRVPSRVCLAHLNVIDGKGRVIRKLKARVTAITRTAVHTVFPTRSICCKRHINSRIIGAIVTIATAVSAFNANVGCTVISVTICAAFFATALVFPAVSVWRECH